MHDNYDFLKVKGIDELSQKLVEKKKIHCLFFDLQIIDIDIDITGDHR
jgi:hypothetical protein